MTPYASIVRYGMADIIHRNRAMIHCAPVRKKVREHKLRVRKHFFSLLAEKFFVAETCIEVVCGHFNVNWERMLSPCRMASIVWPRHCAMTIAYELSSLSTPEVALVFNRLDHSTVIHAIQNVDRKCEEAEVRKQLDSLKGAVIRKLRGSK
jgi:chromosomal replication initiation ATPase DnaA